jgi:hypothetical protein
VKRAGWYSQPFRPDGGITAEGLRNQLGRPALSLLTVLVREAAQNTWDAKVKHEVDFRLDLATVGVAHHRAWSALLEHGVPISDEGLFPLRRMLQSRSIRYLAVSDRGTAGLGGPTRSDVSAQPGQRNWLSFVLNSGERQDTDGGGGTYGYGKGAFFLASKVGTILVYSRFLDDESRPRSRFIGSALWHSFNQDNRPYTGRHWWGLPEQGHCAPLEDQDADDVARQLGIPAFTAEQTGTTVVVLDPDLRDPTLPDEDVADMSMDEAGRYLADAAGWNLWPTMLFNRSPRLSVHVTVQGVEFPVPDELSDAVLATFAAAYRRSQGANGEEIRCGNPKMLLGKFGSETTFGAVVDSPAARELGLEGAPHHVCLLRNPDLVVRYMAGPSRQHPMVGYAGVFKVSETLDATFAQAEPPTHDAWIDSQLQGPEATFVRVARRRLAERCDALVSPKARDVGIADIAVGSVAHRLGHLLLGVGGHGATLAIPAAAETGHRPPATRLSRGSDLEGADASLGMSGRTVGRAALVGQPAFEEIDGRTLIVQRVQVLGPARVKGHATVVTGDGGSETSAPAGGAVPQIYGWRNDGRVVTGDVQETVDGIVETELLVVPVIDAAIEISVAATT